MRRLHAAHRGEQVRADGLEVDGLLQAGRERFEGSQETQFFEADIEDPELQIAPCDIVLFSHVLEIVQSPQKTLLAAKRNAPLVMIRFFEPPVGEFDVTQLLQMNIGIESTVPYLRRTMSAAYYNLILHEVGCQSVEMHQVEGDKDQVHLLRFDRPAQT